MHVESACHSTQAAAPHPMYGGFAGITTKLFAATVTALQALCFRALNLLTRKNGTMRRTVDFLPKERLALDVFIPPSGPKGPVVVFFYGGSWLSGKRQWYRWLGHALARQGLVVVMPDYKKWPQVRMDGFMDDATHAVAWAYRHIATFGGDPRKVFLMGHSAGAHIAALLSADKRWLGRVHMSPCQLAGFIGLAGPYDFLPLKDPKFIDIFGASPLDQKDSQPINFVASGGPPMLLLQGKSDRIVSVNNATALAKAAPSDARSVYVNLYDEMGHSSVLLALSPLFGRKYPVLGDCLRFIRAHYVQRFTAMGRAEQKHDKQVNEGRGFLKGSRLPSPWN